MLTVIAPILFTLTACTGPADEVIRFGLASEPVNLDPRFATDATSARINRLLYRRLVDFDEHMRPVASLATWERLSGEHYRFHLARERSPFHDGRPLTSRDVAATYAYILDPAHASPHRGPLGLIQRIETPNDDTVDFFLQHADPLFPGYLVIGIVSADDIAAGHPLESNPVGSGPFRLEDRPEPGRLRLMRIADGQRIEFLRVVDPTVRVLKLLRGEVDILQNDLPAELLGYLKRQDGIAVSVGPGSNFAYLGFNLQDPVTNDIRVRRAIAEAIDRTAIIRYVLAGAARPAAALLPPNHWAGDPALVGSAYDPQAARSLLAQAGYDADHPLELDYKTSTDPVRIRIATIIQQQLAEVGIDMKLRSYDWGTFYGDIKAGRFQLYSLSWVGIKTPDIFRYAFHSNSPPPEGANRGHLQDDAVDALIEQAEQGATLEAQAQAYRAVQERLLDLLPYLPLWYEDQVCAVRSDIYGYRLAPDGNYDALNDVYRLP